MPSFPPASRSHPASVPAPEVRAGGRGSQPREFEAVIFDMDGVVTDSAAVHALAWKRMFDAFLRTWAGLSHTEFREFSHTRDYRALVDGKPRYRGVADFLASRGIALPQGTPADPPGAETVCGLGNRKNELFNEIIEAEGIRVYASTVALIEELRSAGIRVGLATSSRNAGPVLAKTGTASLFATVVDGFVSERLGLQGKPHPDIFATAAANLDVPAAGAIVVEDAVSGVRAGARGGFGLVVGVAREGNAAELRENGADVVVEDLAELSLESLNQLVRRKTGDR